MTETQELSEAEAVKVAAFGLDKPEEDDMGPFLVHMEGPDDIEYFGTWVEACKYAQTYNVGVLEYNEHTKNPGMIRGWAIPYKTEEHEERWNKILTKPADRMILAARAEALREAAEIADKARFDGDGDPRQIRDRILARVADMARTEAVR